MTPIELVARRQALGLSQSELARMLGVPRLTVWRWESGAHKVPQLMEMALRGVEATLSPPPAPRSRPARRRVR